MEFNNPSEIVKDLSFGNEASDKIMAGVEKLASAVKSTLGASGKCVIYEDALGRPVITKDGVTVAQSVVLMDPVENLGATLIKEAANNTVKEAGDGTTTATVIAHALLKNILASESTEKVRLVKDGLESGMQKVIKYLDNTRIPIGGDMLKQVATISCNNDKELGKIIGKAFKAAGENGVVVMEPTTEDTTELELVDGVQYEKGLTNSHLSLIHI